MRRHPLALALYLVVFLLGLVFITHWYGPNHTEADLFPHVSPWAIFAWKWMMLTGGGVATLSLLLKPRTTGLWPDLADLLHFEGIAAFVAGWGLLIYLVVIVHVTGVSQSGPALALYGVLILGHWWRGAQAIADANRLETLATLTQHVKDDTP